MQLWEHSIERRNEHKSESSFTEALQMAQWFRTLVSLGRIAK
jgi:hypothetical protein